MTMFPRGRSIAALKARYEGLVALAAALPSNLAFPEGIDLERVISELPSDFLQDPGDNDERIMNIEEINRSAFGLALFGWRADNEYMDSMASCDACFRRLGLWLFNVKGKGKMNGHAPDDPTAIHPVIDKLNVLGEHRDYCPWVNPLSQNGTTDPTGPWEGAGWEVLLHTLVGNFLAWNTSPRPSTAFSAATPTITLNGEALEINSIEISSVSGQATSSTARISVAEDRDAKDKERWAKLKKLKKAFDIKPRRKVTSGVN
jgi:hypothetical protein